MKRNRKMLWKDSAAGAQVHKTLFGPEYSVLGEPALLVLCTLFFFGSACGMLQSLLDTELPMESLLFRFFLITVVVRGLMEARYLLKPRFFIPAGLGVGVLGFLVFFLYAWRTDAGDAVLDGIFAIADAYADSWNAYYGLSFYGPSGSAGKIATAVTFVFSALCYLFVWFSCLEKRSRAMFLVPFLVLFASMLVGEVPEGASLLFLFLGVILAETSGVLRPEFMPAPGSREYAGMRTHTAWVGKAVFCLVLFCGIWLGGRGFAEESVDGEADRIKRKQEEFVSSVTDWSGWREFKVSKEWERKINEFLDRNNIETEREGDYAELDNERPEYKDVAVVRVQLYEEPKLPMYLVGFYAGDYKDGLWDTDIEAFEKDCKEAGYDPEEMAESIASLGRLKIGAVFGRNEGAGYENGVSGTLYYAKAKQWKALLPYLSFTDDRRVTVEGDSRYVKEESLTKLDFFAWNCGVEDFSAVLSGPMPEKENWEAWYEDYVMAQYRKVPRGMKQVKAVADTIENVKVSLLPVTPWGEETLERLNTALLVAEWLRYHTDYSIELPEIPEGTDPIEFFLGEGKSGYCMHYASAATMILRELGIPARYVSGYVAANFKKDKSSGMYETVAKDSDGHAWVEIYLDGIGWIPVEVTKGYGMPLTEFNIFDEKAPGGQGQTPGTTPVATPVPGAPTPKVTPPVTPSVTTAPEPGANPPAGTPKPGEEGKPETPDTEKPEATEPPKRTEEKKRSPLNSFSVNPVIMLFIPIGIILYYSLVVPLMRFGRKQERKRDEKKIAKQGANQSNRKKIVYLNRRLYRKLCRQRLIARKKRISDEEYGRILLKACELLSWEDKERYLYLVKEAAFSKNVFTEEEVLFCHRIYRKILDRKML